MQISFSKPLDHAWQRMNAFLFNPFDPGKWFVLGFTAWLADLANGFPGGASQNLRFSQDWDELEVNDWASGGLELFGDFFNNPLAFIIAGMLLTVVVTIGLLVLWVSSRGSFMFLDNLVHTRTEVKAPWTEFRNQGDSLFLWQVVYSLIVLVVMGTLIAGSVMLFFPLAAADAPAMATIPLIILAGTTAFILITTLVFIEFCLFQFVVPIMYRNRVSTTEAWKISPVPGTPRKFCPVRSALFRHPAGRRVPVLCLGVAHLLHRPGPDGHSLHRNGDPAAPLRPGQIPESRIPRTVRRRLQIAAALARQSRPPLRIKRDPGRRDSGRTPGHRRGFRRRPGGA